MVCLLSCRRLCVRIPVARQTLVVKPGCDIPVWHAKEPSQPNGYMRVLLNVKIRNTSPVIVGDKLGCIVYKIVRVCVKSRQGMGRFVQLTIMVQCSPHLHTLNHCKPKTLAFILHYLPNCFLKYNFKG